MAMGPLYKHETEDLPNQKHITLNRLLVTLKLNTSTKEQRLAMRTLRKMPQLCTTRHSTWIDGCHSRYLPHTGS